MFKHRHSIVDGRQSDSDQVTALQRNTRTISINAPVKDELDCAGFFMEIIYLSSN